MKQFILTFILLLGAWMASMQAQGITGKWKCPKEFLYSLMFNTEDLHGHYKFNDDGTFSISVNAGRMRGNASARSVYIKVKGRYSVVDGRITTAVNPEDVHYRVDADMRDPDFPDVGVGRRVSAPEYDAAMVEAAAQEDRMERELRWIWEWKDVPMTLADRTLAIGDRIRLYRGKADGMTGYTAMQTSKASTNYAMNILRHYPKKTARQWAMATLEQGAYKDKSPYSMYTLGKAYIAGTGLKADTVKGIQLLEEAGRMGYDRAYITLGNIFKYAQYGIGQDFSRAYAYYSAGAGIGSAVCIYAKGYMLYKGLGCTQDYRAAVECFKAAADAGHARSMYMLGLCYRNGYGVERNTDRAAEYLNMARKAGCRDAKTELSFPDPESGSGKVSDADMVQGAGAADLPAGSYHGSMVMYDWSGKYIVWEKPMSMTVKPQGREMAGRMSVGKASTSFKAGISSGGTLLFRNGSIMLEDRYAPKGMISYDMRNMAIAAKADGLHGRLTLYSTSSKEPGRPVGIFLKHDCH
ncbi:MAG: tetratricopeptide repeat protein [Prevotellaceae bacterium]|nr:tetratricopeptide repeat protein [Prevotellaceae bacterium]